MIQKIVENLKECQDRIAFQFPEQSYTYRDLAQASGRVAAYLISKGYQNQPVGIFTGNDFATYSAVIGTLLSGNSFVPINPKQPFEYNKLVLNLSGIRELIYSDVVPSAEYSAKVPLTNIQHLPVKYESPEFHVTAEQTAYILFTSGSTGIPKGVPICVSNLDSFLRSIAHLGLSFSADDRFLQMFELTFDLSIFSYLMPLTVGATVVPLDHRYPKYYSIYEAFTNSKVTVALMVPSVMGVLKSVIDELKLPDLRYSLFCGEALLESDLKKWSACCPTSEQWNVYGPTEATIFCTAYKAMPTKSYHGIVSIGCALEGMICSVFDEQGKKITKPEESGELCLAGSQVTKGYLDSELTSRAFFEDSSGNIFYRTGDLAFFDENGDFFFLGRRDSQVKINGFRVELAGIQHCAAQFTQTRSIALHKKLENGNDVIFMFVEAWKGQEQDLRQHIKAHLPEYCWPHKIILIERFSFSINGKINIKALEEYL